MTSSHSNDVPLASNMKSPSKQSHLSQGCCTSTGTGGCTSSSGSSAPGSPASTTSFLQCATSSEFLAVADTMPTPARSSDGQPPCSRQQKHSAELCVAEPCSDTYPP